VLTKLLPVLQVMVVAPFSEVAAIAIWGIMDNPANARPPCKTSRRVAVKGEPESFSDIVFSLERSEQVSQMTARRWLNQSVGFINTMNTHTGSVPCCSHKPATIM